MALLTVLVALTAMMLVTHLTVMTLLVKEKNGKRVHQSKGGDDNNCGLDGPNHNETNSGDGNDDVLGGNRKK
jgi:hypothetical protein